MSLAMAGLFENLLRRPAKVPKIVSQKNPSQQRRCAGPAAHSKGNLILQLQMQRNGRLTVRSQNASVGREDEAVVSITAQVGVTPARVDTKRIGRHRVDGEIDRHRQAQGVEARTKVGGGSGQAKMQRLYR